MGESIATSAGRPRNSVGIATLIVAVLILIAVVGVLGLDVWRTTQPDADGLAGMVQTSMTDYLAHDRDLSPYGPSVGTVSVMRVGENTFEGNADISTSSGKSRMIPVHVHYDGDQMFWDTDPGAFLWLTAPSTS